VTERSAPEIRSLIVKLAERCNIKCKYCYLYEHEDTSYLRRPHFMSDEIFDAMLRRAADHCTSRPGASISLTFHGGEPTLVGTDRFERLVERTRTVLGDRLGRMSIQTNGTLVDRRWARTLAQLGLDVGVSLDGPPDIHDRSRVDRKGRGTWRRVVQGIDCLRCEGVEPAILAVVAPGTSGVDTYEHFLALGIRHINYLLPDVSHDSYRERYGGYGPTPVADYLIPVFDAWFNADDPRIFVALFWDLIERILGGPGLLDVFGNPPLRYLVIETDGSIEALDVLRVCEDGIAASKLNVLDDAFDDLRKATTVFRRSLLGDFALSEICQKCEHREICGGGYLPHRYSRTNGFANPSVWCADLKLLIGHIADAVRRREAELV
jgi:uncharacterized protein